MSAPFVPPPTGPHGLPLTNTGPHMLPGTPGQAVHGPMAPHGPTADADASPAK